MININWTVFFQTLVTTYAPYLETLLGLVILDVIFGVAAALRKGQFQWAAIANFYKSSVLPDVLGWLGLVIATYLVAPGLLGAYANIVSQSIVTLAWLTVVATLGLSIIKSASEVLNINISPALLKQMSTVTPAESPAPLILPTPAAPPAVK